MVLSEKQDAPTKFDVKTMLFANFAEFVGQKMKQTGESMEVVEKKHEVVSRFIDAKSALTSNPFYKPPIDSLQSMEAITKIKTKNAVKDQLRAFELQAPEE